MDELIRIVQEKTGLDAAQARGAADAVLGFLKEKLPPPLGAQIDGLLGGAGGATGAGGNDPLGGLGNLGGLTGGRG